MARRLNYYIMARYNPQLGTYYVKKGQLTKKRAKEMENCIYGSAYLMPYETEEEYLAAVEKLGARA